MKIEKMSIHENKEKEEKKKGYLSRLNAFSHNKIKAKEKNENK